MRISMLTAVSLAAAPAASASAPVVVELFTSQGCSSCPDADALLSTWGMDGFKRGELLPLSYDVDYWDYLGWKDVFSTPAYTRRQRDYAAVLRTRTYTPQMVVAGQEAFVGSDRRAAERETARLAKAAFLYKVVLERPSGARALLGVRVSPPAKPEGVPHVMLAVFENGLSTTVTAGENAGKELRSDFVVRRLVDLGPIEGGKEFHRMVDDSLETSWRLDRLGAAVFVQDAATRAISGAASLYPLSAARPK
ncbi:MAG: DUF1223 domain-containing protein [Elusimicrobia bacterium]|nr:DUF1223 domain-containing protein [Elusimicrobiota bacterium]